jgi:hypothetical protein
MAKEELYGSQFTRLLVNLSRLCPAHRVRAVRRTIEPGAPNPLIDDARVLACRVVRLRAETAREQVRTSCGAEVGQPIFDSASGLLGDFELNRSARLFWITVARSRTLPPAVTSSIFSRTRSQPMSLLSTARLNIARSRLRFSSWSLTRIVQTSLGL